MEGNSHYSPKLKPFSRHLKPFNWGEEKEIRLKDVDVFKATARAFNHIIIVRATNEYSIPYIGIPDFVPKEIDCKPKTASKSAFVNGIQISCAGLVVDPTLLPNAFVGRKQIKAAECWRKFIHNYSDKERELKVFPRQDQAGFYAVDTYMYSDHYGCLMQSVQNIPDKNFRLDDPDCQDYKNKLNMCYIHGDYDLYGLIDVDKVDQGVHAGKVANKEVIDDKLLGQIHKYSPHFFEIKDFLNSGIGTDMVQHGSQDTFEHMTDKLYVFTPQQHAYVLNGSAGTIKEVYRQIFKELPI